MRPHPTPHHAIAGVTLTELLIALTVFLVVLTLASAGIVQTTRVTRHNDDVTTLQSLARRTTQVMAEELRSTAFGTIADEPYASDATRIAFFLPEGPAWPVLPHDSGRNDSFVRASNVQISASVATAEDLHLSDDRVLLRNGHGDAIALHVSNVTRIGGPASPTWNLVHPGCPNTIDYTDGTTVLQAVTSVGYRFDPDTRTVYRTTSAGEEPLAFDVTTFDVHYVYLSAGGDVNVRTQPHRDEGGAPVRRAVMADDVYLLDAIRIEMRVVGETPFGPAERGYAMQIALPQVGLPSALRIARCA